MEQVNYDKLEQRASELCELIDSANRSLSIPVSNYGKQMVDSVSRYGPKLAAQFSKLVSKGKIEEAVIGGAIVGVACLGGYLVDAVRNTVANSKAKELLLGYYQELMSKQNLIIEKNRELNRLLLNAHNASAIEIEQLRSKQRELEQILKKIQRFQNQVT